MLKPIVFINLLLIFQTAFSQPDSTVLLNETDRREAIEMLRLVNDLRAVGCTCFEPMPPAGSLSLDYFLSLAAKASALEMAKTHRMGHTYPSVYGKNSWERMEYFNRNKSWVTGENLIESATVISPYRSYDGWLHSKPHCTGMLTKENQQLGYSAVCAVYNYSQNPPQSTCRGVLMLNGTKPLRPIPVPVKLSDSIIVYGPANHFWTQAAVNFFWWEMIACQFKEPINNPTHFAAMKAALPNAKTLQKDKFFKPILFSDSTIWIGDMSYRDFITYWNKTLKYKKEPPILFGNSDNSETENTVEMLKVYKIKYIYKEGMEAYLESLTNNQNQYDIYPVVVVGNRVYIKAYDYLPEILAYCLQIQL